MANTHFTSILYKIDQSDFRKTTNVKAVLLVHGYGR